MQHDRHLPHRVLPRQIAGSQSHRPPEALHLACIDPCKRIQPARVDDAVVLALDAVPPFEARVVTGREELRPGTERQEQHGGDGNHYSVESFHLVHWFSLCRFQIQCRGTTYPRNIAAFTAFIPSLRSLVVGSLDMTNAPFTFLSRYSSNLRRCLASPSVTFPLIFTSKA